MLSFLSQHPSLRVAAAILACALAAPVLADEISLDYDDYYERLETLKPFQHLTIAVRAVNEDTHAPCATSQVYLKTRKGTELLPSSDNGIVALQAKTDLYDNRTKVIAKTTENCDFVLEVGQKAPESTGMTYSELMVAVPEFRTLLESNSSMFSSQTLNGISLHYPKAAPGSITIHAKAGEQTYTSQNGKLDLPVNDELLKENPSVTLSALPEQILPLAQ